MGDTLLTAFALMLVLEGLLPLLAPRTWRDTFKRITELADGQIRFIGLFSVALGVMLMTIFD